MNRYVHFLGAAAIAMMMGACSSDEPSNSSNSHPETTLPDLTAAQSRVIASFTDNSYRMFDAVKASNDDIDNVVVSPFSAQMFLAMLANGAEGATQASMLNAFGLDAGDIASLNDINSMLRTTLPYLDSRVTLNISNSVWTNEAYLSLTEGFTSVMTDVYAAEHGALTYDGKANRKKLNQWAEKATNGLIKDLYSDEVSDPMVLLQAIYFKAPWACEKVKTSKGKFTSLSGSSKTVKQFKLDGITGYHADDYVAVNAYYGKGSYRLTVVMNADGSLPTAQQAKDAICTPKGYYIIGTVTLPEWDVAVDFKLDRALQTLGFGAIFEKDASFANMTATPVGLPSIYQAVHVITNEKGTEAAAVTGGNFIAPGPMEDIVVDRPFIYIISEPRTGAVLFIGQVAEL